MATIAATGDRSSLQLSLVNAQDPVLKNRAQTFVFGDKEFRIVKEGFFIHDLQLWEGYTLLASQRRGIFSYASGEWRLKCTTRWSEIEYSLYQGKNAVGFIRSTRHWLGLLVSAPGLDFRQMVIDLPDEFPIVVQLFLTWVACYLWTNIDGTGSGD